jgi:hypothetical protein
MHRVFVRNKTAVLSFLRERFCAQTVEGQASHYKSKGSIVIALSMFVVLEVERSF